MCNLKRHSQGLYSIAWFSVSSSLFLFRSFSFCLRDYSFAATWRCRTARPHLFLRPAQMLRASSVTRLLMSTQHFQRSPWDSCFPRFSVEHIPLAKWRWNELTQMHVLFHGRSQKSQFIDLKTENSDSTRGKKTNSHVKLTKMKKKNGSLSQ